MFLYVTCNSCHATHIVGGYVECIQDSIPHRYPHHFHAFYESTQIISLFSNYQNHYNNRDIFSLFTKIESITYYSGRSERIRKLLYTNKEKNREKKIEGKPTLRY